MVEMAYGWFGCLKWKWKYSKLACCSSLVRISSLSDSFVICHILWPEILSAFLGDDAQINVTSRLLEVKQQEHLFEQYYDLLFRIHSCFGVVKEQFLNFAFCDLHCINSPDH